MNDKRKKLVLSFLGAVGFVGVLGQAAKLHNSLVHSYPFKMMGVPSAEFYGSSGNTGYYIAVFGGILAILISFRLPRFLVSTLPVIVCPLVYWIVFEIAHLMHGFTPEQMMERNFGGYTGNTARYEFGFEVLSLLFFGAIIGSVIGYTTNRISQIRTNELS